MTTSRTSLVALCLALALTRVPANAAEPTDLSLLDQHALQLGRAAAAAGQCLDGPGGGTACFLAGWFRDGLRLPEAPASGPYEAVYLTATMAQPAGAVSEVTVVREQWAPLGERTVVAQTLVTLRPGVPGHAVRHHLTFAGSRLLGASTRAATANERQEALSRARALGEDPPVCLPPGISPGVFLWPIVDAQTLAIAGETAQRHGVAVRYQAPGRAVVVVWVDGHLSLVDDDPDGDTPPWVRDAAPSQRNADDGGPPGCQWRRVFPSRGSDTLDTYGPVGPSRRQDAWL